MAQILLLLAAAVLLCVSAVLFFRARNTHDRLDNMIDCAIRGEFQPTRYDESQISRTEQKLAQYLSASVLSRTSLDEDRARIQSLIGDISHQTRTPIANILLYTSLLDEESLTEEQHALAKQACQQAEKLRFLIDSLVKTSHLETGLVQVHPVTSPLAPMLESLYQTYLPAAQDKNIVLTVASTTVSAHFDPKWTTEAVGNLIDNAIKYTPKGGTVQLTVQDAPMYCAVCVADSGPGIAETEHAKIFARFYRAPSAAQIPGVGIGLYLTRQILRAQNGYIKVSSAPGKGAVFSAFLPKN